MKYALKILFKIAAVSLLVTPLYAADTVPTDIQMPGTQPGEAANFESAESKCANCHAGYNDGITVGEPQDEPMTGWWGAGMANAGRDAIFWATLAVAEQDFDGAGDLCIRCHSTVGWYGGRSTPTDGSALASTDDEGVNCDTCHSMTNTDNSEFAGVTNAPFTANCSDDLTSPAGTCDSAAEGYYGSGMLSVWDGGDKLGPYAETVARHAYAQSLFHRDVDFCGSCHDVSNPVVGDLAPNHGVQATAPQVVSSGGVLGGPVEDKAAFNNPPYAYGIVERTFSEYKASAFPTTRVGHFNSLPADLRAPGGSLETTYQAAIAAAAEAQANGGIAGDYADGTPRYFSCQSCHMRPVESAGAGMQNAPVRKDLPAHDHTGGNYWFADITRYQDSKGTLRLGGGLSSDQEEALELAQQRAVAHLQQAASLQLVENTLRVVNLTGHKLISGYPEGRRMWVNIKWYDAEDALLREDGAYGPIGATVANPSGGPDVAVESLLDLGGSNTRIYEAHYAVTRDWASTIAALHGNGFVLNYDRMTGDIACTVGDFLLDDGDPGKKDACKGDHIDTFHFALNNDVASDNRIPPYGMQYDIALRRNTLPVPADQYGGGGSGSVYNHWDDITLNPPAQSDHAHIELLYQGTSWEYIQFLYLANDGQSAFLGQEGVNMLDAWLNSATSMDPLQRTMVAPIVMASIDWVADGSNQPPTCAIDNPPADVEIQVGDDVDYAATASDSDGTIAGYSWSFEGGYPSASGIEDPGLVAYDVAGVYQTTFEAVDDLGATCSPASIGVTVLEPETFTIGGTVSGLAGSGLVLQNNLGDDLAVAGDGGFTFATPLADGSDYSVTVKTQPADPVQVCSVSNGSGTLAGANVNDVTVNCVTEAYTIGGNVGGLAGSGLVLQNNLADDLVVAGDGSFTFATPLADGSGYSVTVKSQPLNPSQVCGVSNGSGTLSGANVTDVAVTCVTMAYTVGGTISGLAGSGLVLQNNLGDDLAVAGDGGFTFATPLADGSSYSVTVKTQPTDPVQVCSVSNGSGTLAGANITDVTVICAIETYTVGGTVSGLAGSGLVLQNNLGDDLAVAGDGGFTFATPLADGSSYSVTVKTQPTGPVQVCSVSNGGGALSGSNVTDVTVTCQSTCNLEVVAGATETTEVSHEACEVLVIGDSYVAGQGAVLTLSAGLEINILPGFTIEKGATLDARVCGQSLCSASATPMPYGCHSCVTRICDLDPACCTDEYSQSCLDKVGSVCGLTCE